MIKQSYWRVHQNFLMRDRIPEYRALLSEAKDRGYTSLTISDLAACASGRAALPSRALILRNDVDTDPSTAREMFEVEKALGLRATYYFRLSTLDAALMRDMQDYGAEVGYHFEEVATATKRWGLRNADDVSQRLDSIRERFRRNIRRYETAAGRLPRTVASHGDFANRAIRTTNACIINQDIRDEFSILAEAYDEWLNAPVSLRVSDSDAPLWWKPITMAEALSQGPKCLYVLLHPRQWRANPWENVKADMVRVAEGAMLSATQTFHR